MLGFVAYRLVIDTGLTILLYWLLVGGVDLCVSLLSVLVKFVVCGCLVLCLVLLRLVIVSLGLVLLRLVIRCLVVLVVWVWLVAGFDLVGLWFWFANFGFAVRLVLCVCF